MVKDAKQTIIDLMEIYSKEQNNTTKEDNLIEQLKEYSCANISENDNNYKFCWCTLSSYCGYYINSNGNIVVIEWDKPIQHEAGTEIDLQTIPKENYKKLNTKNGYIINPDDNNSPYIQIKNREIKLATNEDIYKFMAGAGWLENTDTDKNYKKIIEEAFKNESLEIHHINNNPNDNRVENLIFLPRSIHSQAHKYNKDKDK